MFVCWINWGCLSCSIWQRWETCSRWAVVGKVGRGQDILARVQSWEERLCCLCLCSCLFMLAFESLGVCLCLSCVWSVSYFTLVLMFVLAFVPTTLDFSSFPLLLLLASSSSSYIWFIRIYNELYTTAILPNAFETLPPNKIMCLYF